MKTMAILIALLCTTAAHARQYIQCAEDYTFNRVVINLDGDNSTIFLTNGVHRPDEQRVIKDLKYITTKDSNVIYSTFEGSSKETILIPEQFINVASNYFQIEMQVEVILKSNFQKYYDMKLSCFSSLH